jgi:hypothetical protein
MHQVYLTIKFSWWHLIHVFVGHPMELASCYHSDAQNTGVAFRFLKNVCTLEIKRKHYTTQDELYSLPKSHATVRQ